MARQEGYKFEEDILRRANLSEEDAAIRNEFVQDDKETAEMLSLLEGIEDWSHKDDMVPDKAVKANLMAAFKQERNRKGLVWLNSLWLWLWPEDKAFYRAPAFQLVAVSACVVIIIMAVNVFDSNDKDQTVAQEVSDRETQDIPKDRSEIEDGRGTSSGEVGDVEKDGRMSAELKGEVLNLEEGEPETDEITEEDEDLAMMPMDEIVGGESFGEGPTPAPMVADDEIEVTADMDFSSSKIGQLFKQDEESKKPAPPDGYRYSDKDGDDGLGLAEEQTAADQPNKEIFNRRDNLDDYKLSEDIAEKDRGGSGRGRTNESKKSDKSKMGKGKEEERAEMEDNVTAPAMDNSVTNDGAAMQTETVNTGVAGNFAGGLPAGGSVSTRASSFTLKDSGGAMIDILYTAY